MPRKRKIEPPPRKTFTYDGVIYEERDETCWALGRGQASALEHYLDRIKPIYYHINNLLFASPTSNELRRGGIEEVKRMFNTPSSFAHQLSLWGILGTEGADDTNARKNWYPRLKHEVLSAIRAFEEQP